MDNKNFYTQILLLSLQKLKEASASPTDTPYLRAAMRSHRCAWIGAIEIATSHSKLTYERSKVKLHRIDNNGT